MKKILAAIIEYKLNKNDLDSLVQKIIIELNHTDSQYPDTFNNQMRELLINILGISLLDSLSAQDEKLVMDTLKEMELILVDYLSQVAFSQTNDCFLH